MFVEGAYLDLGCWPSPLSTLFSIKKVVREHEGMHTPSNMLLQDDAYPVARMTTSVGKYSPVLRTTVQPSSPYPSARAGDTTLMIPSFTKEWKLLSRTTPSSFVRVFQNNEGVRRKGESAGISYALNYEKETLN